jgi:hypothetical protein
VLAVNTWMPADQVRGLKAPGSSPAMMKEEWTYLTALSAGLEVDGTPVSVKHSLLHRL